MTVERFNRQDREIDKQHLTQSQTEKYKKSLKCACGHKFYPHHNEKGECFATDRWSNQCDCRKFHPHIENHIPEPNPLHCRFDVINMRWLGSNF